MKKAIISVVRNWLKEIIIGLERGDYCKEDLEPELSNLIKVYENKANTEEVEVDIDIFLTTKAIN